MQGTPWCNRSTKEIRRNQKGDTKSKPTDVFLLNSPKSDVKIVLLCDTLALALQVTKCQAHRHQEYQPPFSIRLPESLACFVLVPRTEQEL